MEHYIFAARNAGARCPTGKATSVQHTEFRLGALLVLLACATALGEGGPPLIGDDPGTPGNGHWEINIGYPYLRAAHQVTMETPHIDLNYGLGDHIQLKCEAGYMIGKNDDQSWKDGVDNPLLGMKWRFLDEEKSGVDLSVYPQVGFNTSSALGRVGLVNSGTSVFIPFKIGKSFGKFELDAEAGYQYVERGQNNWVAGLIVGYKLTERIELLGEVRATVDDGFRHTDVIFDGGARIGLNDNLAIIFATGRSVRTDEQSTSLYAYVGCRVTF
jgi:hypothetical protein